MASIKFASVMCRRLPVIKSLVHSQPIYCNSNQFLAAYSTRKSSPEVDDMIDILKTKFPLAKNIEVNDISGGCGDMYEINVESVEFKGLTIVKQHRLVNDALKDQISEMHGLRIQTSVPPASMK